MTPKEIFFSCLLDCQKYSNTPLLESEVKDIIALLPIPDSAVGLYQVLHNLLEVGGEMSFHLQFEDEVLYQKNQKLFLITHNVQPI